MRVFIFLITITLLSQSTIAQQTLSLSDAIAIGLERNYDIQLQNGQVDIDRNNNSYGEAGRWPSITFSLSQDNSITDNVKTASPFALQGQIYNNSLAPQINLNWVLFDGFKISINKRKLEQLEAETLGNAEIVISNTIQAIILGYYLAVLEKQRLEEFSKNLQLSKDRYTYLDTKRDMGAASTMDLLVEEANYLTDSVNVLNQRQVFKAALTNLNFLLSEQNLNHEYILSDSLKDEKSDYNYFELKEKMLAENVDLKTQYISQSILQTNSNLAKADRYPTLVFDAGAVRNMGRSDLSRTSLGSNQRDSLQRNPNAQFNPDYLQPLSSTTNNYYANFTLTFNLFNGGKINRAIQNALIEEDIGELRIEQLESSLDKELILAFERYQTRKHIYTINKLRLKSAETNLNVSEEKFKNGSINSFDNRFIQNNYLSASSQMLESLYSLMESKIELMRLTGGIVSSYNQ